MVSSFLYPCCSTVLLLDALASTPNLYWPRTNQHSASYDILRQYDLTHTASSSLTNTTTTNTSATPFLIVPGHRTGVISQLYLDPTCSFMISTGGNRGWEGATTEVLLGYEIAFGS